MGKSKHLKHLQVRVDYFCGFTHWKRPKSNLVIEHISPPHTPANKNHPPKKLACSLPIKRPHLLNIFASSMVENDENPPPLQPWRSVGHARLGRHAETGRTTTEQRDGDVHAMDVPRRRLSSWRAVGNSRIGRWHWMDHQKIQLPNMEGFWTLQSCFRYISRIHTAYKGEDSSMFTWAYWWIVKLCAYRNQWLMLMQWDCQMVIVNAGYRDVDGQNQTIPETQSTWLSMKGTAEKVWRSLKKIQYSNTQ